MTACTTCGHQLGADRFCTHCGAPVDWRTDTAERKLPPVTAPPDPRTPPAASAPPPPPRFPLFADEVDSWPPEHPPAPETVPETAPETAPEADSGLFPWAVEVDGHDHYLDHEGVRTSPWRWILVAVLVLALLAAAWWFLVRDQGGEDRAEDRAQPGVASAGEEVASRTTVEAPRTAPPHQDVTGKRVSYDASNMLDGLPETAWRAAGDGTGMALRFTLPEATELHQVGLINGYAKTSEDDQGRSFDWYLGNRRITEVVWLFQGGVKVRQQLDEGRGLQLMDIDPVTTRRVVLRLFAVTEPGEGTASRDFTAISEVSLVGVPQED